MDGLTSRNKLLLLQSLFPCASAESLADGIAMTKTVEEAVWRIHSTENPDMHSAAFLMHEGKKAKSVVGTVPPGRAFRKVEEMLFSRLATLENSVNTEVSPNHEYNAVIRAFPVDTGRWDEYFITSSTLTDNVGGRPLELPTNDDLLDQDDLTRTPIVRWAPTAAELKREMKEAAKCTKEQKVIGNEENKPLVKVSVLQDKMSRDSPEKNGTNSAAGAAKKDSGSSKDHSVICCSAPSSMDFCTSKIDEWSRSMDRLESWKNVFTDSNTCDLCREITEYCKDLVAILPELTPKLLHVIEEEARGGEIAPATHGLRVEAFGGLIVNFGAVRIREILFGKSYVKVDTDLKCMVVSFRVKIFILEPVLFSYQKANNDGCSADSRGRSTSGVVNVKLKNLKVKAMLDLILSAAGGMGIYCRKVRVSIGSIQTKCSVTKLHIIGVLLRPIIRSKLRGELERFFKEGMKLEKI